jgi:hypothetical protein
MGQKDAGAKQSEKYRRYLDHLKTILNAYAYGPALFTSVARPTEDMSRLFPHRFKRDPSCAVANADLMKNESGPGWGNRGR